jgi:outer membrane protein assembly factor BamB
MRHTTLLFLLWILSCLIPLSVQAMDWLTELQNESNDRQEVNINLPLKQVWMQNDSGRLPVYMNNTLYTVKGRRGWFNATFYINEVDQATGEVKVRYKVGKLKNYKYYRMLGYAGRCYVSTVNLKKRGAGYDLQTYVFAFDTRTKKTAWVFTNSALFTIGNIKRVGTYLTAAENKIVVASVEVSETPKLFCLDAVTGRELWRSDQPKGYINNTYVPIAEGKVFVHTMNDIKDEGGHLAALDLNTGKVLWDTEFKELDQEKLKKYKVKEYFKCQAEYDVSLIWKDKILYVPLSYEIAYFRYKAFEAQTGKLLWDQRIFPSMPYSTGILDAKYSYNVAYDENISKITRNDGKIIWQKFAKSVSATLRLQGSVWLCYSTHVGNKNSLHFISKEDGKELSSYPLVGRQGIRQGYYIDHVITLGNRILVGEEDGTYYMLEGAR